jgi:hypothetical protein
VIRPFDYKLPAELFMESRKRAGRPLGYRTTAAEAIRFAIEELPTIPALRTWMNVGDERFDSEAIRQLYESGDYPSAPRNSVSPVARARTNSASNLIRAANPSPTSG